MIYVFVAVAMGAFDDAAFSSRRSFVGRPARALLTCYGVLFMAFFLLKAGDQYSRLIVFLMALITLPGAFIERMALFSLITRKQLWQEQTEVLLVDNMPLPPSASNVRVIDASALGLSTELSSLDNLTRIADFGGRVARIVVLCPVERRQAWAMALKCLAVRSEICVPELESLRPLELGDGSPYTSVVVSENPLNWRQAAVKRAVDIVVSAGLIVLLSPILLVTAIAIRLESPGPALFRQNRLGFGNRTFVVLKFRSMRHEQADAKAAKLTARNDRRTTKVGNFIRRTSIDELPQLFNVLMGDMSLVGPRPHAPAALAGEKLYWEVDENYWHRHIAKPGITGLAQVRGFRGSTFEEDDLRSRLNADLEYVANWSLVRDIEIMLATLRVMVHDRAF
jgi:exopolysaccharide biosynthesis polyprenyl glycosylphosphotransferase